MRRILVLTTLAIALFSSAASAQTPYLVQQGRLVDTSDTGVDAELEVTFRIWKAPTTETTDGTTPVWTSTQRVRFAKGLYVATLGVATPFAPDTFAGDRWLSLTIAGTELVPRLRIGSVPLALRAQSTATADHAAHAARADLADEATHALAAATAEKADEATHAASADDADEAARAALATDAENLGGRAASEFALKSDVTSALAAAAPTGYARLDGATFTGALSAPAPTADAHVATKAYVDSKTGTSATNLAQQLAAISSELSDLRLGLASCAQQGKAFNGTSCVSVGADQTPDAFSFTTQTGREPLAVVTSNEVTLAGFDGSLAAELSGEASASLVVDGNATGQRSAALRVGQKVAIRLTTANSNLGSVTATLTVGTLGATWTVQTRAMCSVKQVFATPGTYIYTVPVGCSRVTARTWGAGGAAGSFANGYSDSDGGGGGFSRGQVAVTAGENLDVTVGSGGRSGSAPGYTGTEGVGGGGSAMTFAGPGGGYSAVARAGTMLVLAGGGGAGGTNSASYRGGAGGGATGQAGEGTGGAGGTASNGGAAASSGGAGQALKGGASGGGGGWFGGGGSDWNSGGAGGGSGYVHASVNAAVLTTGTYRTPGGSTDPDFVSSSAYGGTGTNSNSDPESHGKHGRVVLTFD